MEDIKLYLNMLKKRWLWAGGTFIVVFCVLGIYRALNTVPLYRSTGAIIFNSRSSSLLDPLSLSSGGNDINNNLVILRSDSLAKTVKGNLPFNISQDSQDFVRRLRTSNPERSDVIELSYTHGDPEKAKIIVDTWIESFLDLNKELQLSQTKDLSLFLQKQIPENEENLQTTAEQLKNFKQENRILDIEAEAGSTVRIIGQLDSQVANVKSDLASLRARRDSLRQIFPTDSETAITASFVNESPVVSSLIDQIQKIDTKIEQEQLRFGQQHPQVVNLKRQEELLREQLNKYAPNIFVNGNVNQNDLTQVYQPGTTQTRLLVEYAQVDQDIKSLEAQLISLNQLMNDYRQRVDTLPNLEFEEQKLQRELSSRDNVVQNLVEAYQDAQISLNNTQDNVRMVEPASLPIKPDVDSKFTYIVQGLLGGIIIGSIVAYLRDQLDTGISNLDQIKQFFDLPVLAEIPDFEKKSKKNGYGYAYAYGYFRKRKDEDEEQDQTEDNNQEETTNKKKDLPVKDTPRSPISEAFRGLCTSIKFMEKEEESLRVLTFSSSVAGEGKSTLAANAAIAASQLGGRVLVIEADLRKPGQRKIWKDVKVEKDVDGVEKDIDDVGNELKKRSGLGDLLQANNNLDWSKQVVNVLPNLDILSAGKSKSNPVALIGSPQMVDLLDDLKQKYEWIILDAPPVSVASDAQILGRMSDGMIMVVREGKVNTSMLKAVSESLRQSEVQLLGLMLNCFSAGGGGYYYYNYYYNYSYYYDNKNKKQGKNNPNKGGQMFSNKK